jgi:hypothetical protein
MDQGLLIALQLVAVVTVVGGGYNQRDGRGPIRVLTHAFLV